MKKHKLDIMINEEDYIFLKQLKEKTSSSLAELMRNSIKLLKRKYAAENKNTLR